jgi:hypothetical protein
MKEKCNSDEADTIDIWQREERKIQRAEIAAVYRQM